MHGSTDFSPVVVFVNHWAAEPGGAEYSLLDIMARCSERAAVHLVTSEQGELVEKARRIGITCHVYQSRFSLKKITRWNPVSTALFSLPGLVSYALFIVHLRKLLGLLRPAVIHANVPKSHLVLPFLGAPHTTALFLHMREIFDTPSLVRNLYSLLFRSRQYHIICISHAVRSALPDRLHSRASVIHNGIKVPAIPSVTAVPAAGPRFIYLGRIVPWKGIHLLIEMFGDLAAWHPDRCGTLTLVGDTRYWDNAYRKTLADLIARRRLETRCRLLPHTDAPYETLGSHDIFVCAADREPFGRSVAEAQACGLAVVAWNNGGVPEIVKHEHTGILVEWNDREQFTRALERFCIQPKLAVEMGRNGHRRMGERFEVNNQMQLIVDTLLNETADQP